MKTIVSSTVTPTPVATDGSLSLEILPPDAPESKELLQVVQSNSLAPATAATLHQSFAPLFKEAYKILVDSKLIVVTDPSDKLKIKMAREYRLALRRVRINSEKTKDNLKAEATRYNSAVQGFHNIMLHLVESEETRLDEQEKIAERMEAERKAALKTKRIAELIPFGIDPTAYQLDVMAEDAYSMLLDNSRIAFEAKQESARKAEAERIERENVRLKEEARLREENERLKREQAEKDRIAKIEREQAEIERKKLEAERLASEKKAREEREESIRKQKQLEEKSRKEREAADLKAKQERDAIEARAKADREKIESQALKERQDAALALAEQTRKATEAAAIELKKVQTAQKLAADKAAKEKAELEKQAKLEREAREKAEAEAKRIKDAEEAKIKAEQEAKKRAAAAPDKDKLKVLAKTIRSLEVPKLTTANGIALVEKLKSQVEKFAVWVEGEAAKL